MTITQRIFDIMDERGISQAELSQKTDISTSAISAWKKKGTFPSSDKIPKIAECLNVSVSELYGAKNCIAIKGTLKKRTGTRRSHSISKIGAPQLQTAFALPKATEPKNTESKNTSTIDLYNPHIAKAYNRLTVEEQLDVQQYILKKAAASEKSSATVVEIKK